MIFVVVVVASCTLHLVCAKETVQEHMYTKKLGQPDYYTKLEEHHHFFELEYYNHLMSRLTKPEWS